MIHFSFFPFQLKKRKENLFLLSSDISKTSIIYSFVDTEYYHFVDIPLNSEGRVDPPTSQKDQNNSVNRLTEKK